MEGQGRTIELRVPADMEYLLIANMTLSGFGMVAGLEVGMIDDLRTATRECFDCLFHQQAFQLQEIHVTAAMENGRFRCKFSAIRTVIRTADPPQDSEMSRYILETLLPDVHLHCDEDGVYAIECSMPV